MTHDIDLSKYRGKYTPIPGKGDVQIISILPLGQGQYELYGKEINSGRLMSKIITERELENLQLSDTFISFKGNPQEALFAAYALYYKFMHQFDKAMAMGSSHIDPLPFQIEAVYEYMIPMAEDRLRFLLADDPGAGKTIMAGLLLKELILRNLVERIIIVVPGHLKYQWKREMEEKFGIDFKILEGSDFYEDENPFLKNNRVIVSIDLIKRDDRRDKLEACRGEYKWDMVIIDEAHKLTARTYISKKKKKVQKTNRYKAGEILSKTSEHMLLLTATPHSGDSSMFFNLLKLLYPELDEDSLWSLMKQERIMLRRLKEDLRDFEGRPLFLPRNVQTVSFHMTPEEKELYQDLTEYIKTVWGKASQIRDDRKRRNISFALTILQRRLASSVEALLSSLEKRKERLLSESSGSSATEIDVESIRDLVDLEDYEDEYEIEQIEESLIHFTSFSKDELDLEISYIDRLIEKAQSIIDSGSSSKWEKFIASVRKAIDLSRSQGMGGKVLIFTEYKDTLRALEERLEKEGFVVTTIHGGMDMHARRERERYFKEYADIMVATDAAGEGVNLQFCNIMFNYDIPWNPNRLEQRMGRIHRYGQQYEVFIYNLVAEDTREGAVLKRLLEKLEEIRQSLGGDKVFDVIGEIIKPDKLAKIIEKAVLGARSREEFLSEVDAELSTEKVREILSALNDRSLVVRDIDIEFAKRVKEISEEVRLTPEYVAAFVSGVWNYIHPGCLKYLSTKGIYRVSSVPADIKAILEDEDFMAIHGVVNLDNMKYIGFGFPKKDKNYPESIQWVVPGHPVFEATVQYVNENMSNHLRQGAVVSYPQSLDGTLWLIGGIVRDARGKEIDSRLMAILDTADGNISTVHPMIVWDLEPSDMPVSGSVDINKAKGVAAEKLREFERDIKNRVQGRKIRILESAMVALDKKKKKLMSSDKPENIKLAEIKKIEKRMRKIDKDIEIAESVSSELVYYGVLRIIPEDGESMVSDDEIEKIGMEVAMQHERKQGRIPTDVSANNLGYDIYSQSEDGKERRYIEVKARKSIGDIVLTMNEWVSAVRKGDDYYLYIVANAATSPELYIVRNPASVFKPSEHIRFVVDKEQWLKFAERGE